MPTRIVWSNLAQQTLLDIYVSIGLENPKAADRYYDRLKESARLLADQPRMGRRRPEIEPSIRALVVSPHLIFYRTRPDDDHSLVELVDIVAVIDGRRDLEQLSWPPEVEDSSPSYSRIGA